MQWDKMPRGASQEVQKNVLLQREEFITSDKKTRYFYKQSRKCLQCLSILGISFFFTTTTYEHRETLYFEISCL